MAWELLPVDYTDATWTGLKKYNEVSNDDGTVSFQDVTQYKDKEKSFFGALQANRMNEALNTIMSMVESGTDLYTAFQNYFAAQKVAFENKANTNNADFEKYLAGLKVSGDQELETIKTNYRKDIDTFEDTQEKVFTTWFELVKGQLSEDAAGKLLNQIMVNKERWALLETMCLTNNFITPLATDDAELTVITDDLGNAILADWKYKEV